MKNNAVIETVIEIDGVKYYDCPECGGTGEQMVAKLYPSGHTECWDECEFCDGIGQFEELDYLALKLEGKI